MQVSAKVVSGSAPAGSNAISTCMPAFLQRGNPTPAASEADKNTLDFKEVESESRLRQLMETPGVLYLPASDGSTQTTSNYKETSRIAELRENLRMRLILGARLPQASQASFERNIHSRMFLTSGREHH